MHILGIDIGGSGIKGAPVDVVHGTLLAERHRLPTPQPSTPAAVALAVKEITQHFKWQGVIGCTFPAVVGHGVTHTAANVDPSWIGTNAVELISQTTGCPTVMLNDADAAGLAEMRFGAGAGQTGVVMLITIGTGIGTVMFVNGQLVPNLELGHVILPNGRSAENYAADRVRQKHDLSWKKWGRRFNRVLGYYEALFWPDLFILGGGVCKEYDRFAPYLKTRARVLPAHLKNDAGIIGAAIAAHNALGHLSNLPVTAE